MIFKINKACNIFSGDLSLLHWEGHGAHLISLAHKALVKNLFKKLDLWKSKVCILVLDHYLDLVAFVLGFSGL